MDNDLLRKARRCRELAREVLDETLRAELQKLAAEYETMASRRPQAPPLDPAA